MFGRLPGDCGLPPKEGAGWRARLHGIRLRYGSLVTLESMVSTGESSATPGPLRLPEDFGLSSDKEPEGSRGLSSRTLPASAAPRNRPGVGKAEARALGGAPVGTRDPTRC